MVPLVAYLALFFNLWTSYQAKTVLLVTPENEVSLRLAADLYHAAQEAVEALEKERLLRQSIDVYPEIAAAYNNLAMLIYERQERDEALQLLQRGLQAAKATHDQENLAKIHNNLGLIIRESGKLSVAFSLHALEHFEEALAIDLNFVEALYNKASVMLALRRNYDSLELLQRVVELEPDYQQAHLDLGRIFFEHGNLEYALKHEDHVILMATTTEEKLQGLHNKGVFLKEYNLLSSALEVYNEMLAIDALGSYVLVDLMNVKRSLCDWQGMELLESQVIRAAQQQLELKIVQDAVIFLPFDLTLLRTSDHFRKLLAVQASKVYEQSSTLQLLPLAWSSNIVTWNRPRTPTRLKVGYLSFDFRDHPMSHLTLGLIEQHAALARNVNTICYSYGPNSVVSASWRRLFEEKCDVFRDLLGVSDLEAAQMIALDEIDILVDLMAHTKGARLGITSLRPSRIILNYLGYPGTMGSTFTDFVMVDQLILPPEVAAASMTEQVIYLPNTYQVNRYEPSIFSCIDSKCQGEKRLQHGLPLDVVVFCNFNTINKMESTSFAVWMSILRQVPTSVLWLLAPTGPDAPRVIRMLQEQAMAHGVLPSRVIFAPKINKSEHLERITLADLFLDSFIYNAHSTAADALWANIPIVTMWGDTFPSRVAASLVVNAFPFPELIAQSIKDYEHLAVYLAKTPTILHRIRKELASHTLTSPLFNTKQTTESIEFAYEVMHDVVNRLRSFSEDDQKPRFQLIIQASRAMKAENQQKVIHSCISRAIKQGIALQDVGDFVKAQNVYLRVLRASPANSDANHLLGTLYYKSGHFDHAVEYLSRAVALNPVEFSYHFDLASSYVSLRQFALAETEFQAALQLDPFDRMTILKLSEVYAHRKAFDKIVDLYAIYGEVVFSISANQDEIRQAFCDYSIALDKTGRSQEAIDLLENATKLYPTIYELHLYLGALYIEHERYEEGNQLQAKAVQTQARSLFATQGRYFPKIPRPHHKVVLAFYCHEYGQSWWDQWGPSSLNAGLGGSEEAVVFLSRKLQNLGYWVEIYGDPSRQDISTLDEADEDTVRWYPHYAYDPDDTRVDIFVAWRYHISLAIGLSARKRLLWMHDLPQLAVSHSIELLYHADGIVCLSAFHASAFPAHLQSKITIVSNAVDQSFFVDGANHANRFVYGSSPNRGLYTLLKAWPRIREHIPSAELSVFYGFTPAFLKWGNNQMTDFADWVNEMEQLLNNTPGVRYVGLVNHVQLAEEYANAGFYLYPTTFSETSCISLMKAMANGAIPLTSRYPLSALPETVNDFDLGPRPLQRKTIGTLRSTIVRQNLTLLVDDDPEWLELWIQNVIKAVDNKQLAKTVRERMKRFARDNYRWDIVASKWHQLIK
ncbi:tpr repeat protein (modular protein) [Plasmopara halstedii]|uniref:protein O-GlcNAc transferase n=1 Tax=Plasmopara halstedii TaxID=4781 RepID=A0A0P1ADU7_PLAHL|nr:tpr repeat protein (modular protein) [Plasmopara halstedii]CEG38532.1 tpr repeat protein (modular protein) [Plasmopara halstedii]|eukprot:XP_024574901.1 tpr repeat protein (modular protein) [Plasmopara halstedii]